MTTPDEERIRQAREKADQVVQKVCYRIFGDGNFRVAPEWKDEITTAITSAFQAGRVAGIEEGAKLAEKYIHICNPSDDYIPNDTEIEFGKEIAKVIRLLAVPKAGGKP